MYRLFVPTQAASASLVYFDFFNEAGSGFDVEVLSVLPIVSGAVAVVGAVAVDLYLTRTTAIGTGGTAATSEGTSLSAATISDLSGSQALNGSITARRAPSGGATAGAVVCFRSVFTEETNSAAYALTLDMARASLDSQQGVGLYVRPGGGFRVVQGTVASVGNIGFDVIFKTIQKA